MTRRLAVAALLAASLPACKRSAPEPLAVVLAGCTAWAPSGACEYTAGTQLRVWFEAPGPVSVHADGARLTQTSTRSGVGRRLAFTLPEQVAHDLEIVVGPAHFTLPIDRIETSTPSEPRRRAARALLDGGRSALRAGALDVAVTRLTRSASVARGVQDGATARDADLLASFVEVVLQGDVRAATRRLTALPAPPRVDGRGRILDHFHRGLLAARTANVRRALEHFSEAATWAVRLDSPYLPNVRHERARVLMDHGRPREAAVSFDALLSAVEPEQSCLRAAFSVSAGWARLVARPPFERAVARRHFEVAEGLYSSACPRPADANNARVDLAFLVADDDPAAARAYLAQVQGPEQAESALWRRALLARLDLRAGDLDASNAGYLALREGARAQLQAPLEWQAEVGAGQVARRRGQLAEATARFEAAEAVLDRQGELVPVNRGRRFLLEDRSESLQLLVSAHLAAGQANAALSAVRRARRRTARSVAARDALALLSEDARLEWSEGLARYRAARDEVRALAAESWSVAAAEAPRLASARARAEQVARGALDALLHSIAGAGWFEATADLPAVAGDTLLVAPFAGVQAHHVFVAFEGRTTVHTSPRPLDAAAWSRLLAPLLGRAARVRVLADPSSNGPTLESLSWQGRPLAAAVPVAYALDLGPAPAPARPPSGALIVFDPRGDLADARVEGKEVAAVLSKRGPVATLGPLEARPEEVLRALSGRRLFHFAGHGRYGGPQGWQSALLLVDGTLDMGDLLTLSEPPPWVVLTGCETARTREGRVSAGLGLSQVLLAAGSEVVIATRAPVDSRVALAFSRALYRALQDRDDLESAFVGAVAALAADGAQWQDFLLLVRSP